jgi:hypothetical protein
MENKRSVVPGKAELLFNKLRRPIHYSYVAKYILKESNEKTLETLTKLVNLGLLEESKYSQGYYVSSTGPSGPSRL